MNRKATGYILGWCAFLLIVLVFLLMFTSGSHEINEQKLMNNDCFVMGFNAQIIKDGKVYCCGVNDGDKIINCTAQR